MDITLNGIGASSGSAEGKARWILVQEDIARLEVGEVLLAKMTSPDWGEIFQKAAAVATEQGGMLCHAAIVAREEGIPAVVGIGEELGKIKDGEVVFVSGEDGVVILRNS